MIPGVGPMRQVKSNLSYSVFYGSRTVKFPDTYNKYQREMQKGKEEHQNGLLVFATAHGQVMIQNWNENSIEPETFNLSNLKPYCCDFAPFLNKPTLKSSDGASTRASTTKS